MSSSSRVLAGRFRRPRGEENCVACRCCCCAVKIELAVVVGFAEELKENRGVEANCCEDLVLGVGYGWCERAFEDDGCVEVEKR